MLPGRTYIKKSLLMRLDERGMRACASSPMPRLHYTIRERHLVGVLLEFHVIEHQGVSGWLTFCECIFSRRLTRSWLDAENNSCIWHHLKYELETPSALGVERILYTCDFYGVPCMRGLINVLLMGSGFMAEHRVNSFGHLAHNKYTSYWEKWFGVWSAPPFFLQKMSKPWFLRTQTWSAKNACFINQLWHIYVEEIPNRLCYIAPIFRQFKKIF